MTTRGTTAISLHGAVHADVDELWACYAKNADLDARNALLLAYEGLVRHVVSHLPATVRSHWETDDLVSLGLFGLIDALRRWDTSQPSRYFKAYAQQRIRGAIFDELRSLDWLPRSVRQRVIAYRSTVDQLSNELGRTPASEEVFATLEVDAREGYDLLSQVQSAQLLHLHHDAEAGTDENETRLVDLLPSDDDEAPETQILGRERRAELLEAITQLPERERMVVALYFLDGLTQEQVGRMLGVSNSRICQIQASAVQTLRRLLVTKSKSTTRPIG